VTAGSQGTTNAGTIALLALCPLEYSGDFNGPSFTSGSVYQLQTYDDGLGGGPAIFGYGSIGGASTAFRRWNGSQFAPVGGGAPNGGVTATAGFAAGAKSELYIGGLFDTVAGVGAKNVARWDGTSWRPVGAGSAAQVTRLAVADYGPGPRLLAVE